MHEYWNVPIRTTVSGEVPELAESKLQILGRDIRRLGATLETIMISHHNTPDLEMSLFDVSTCDGWEICYFDFDSLCLLSKCDCEIL